VIGCIAVVVLIGVIVASVRLKGRWGAIDQSGKQVIQPKYDNLDPFSTGWRSHFAKE